MGSKNLLNGNEAVARVAYQLNDFFPIYPITPSSEMSEQVERWAAEGKENLFGRIPEVIEMQNEAGVAGAMHGAIQCGALSSTFTASQGLLLMMPNMYKIAGQLFPNAIHVATRTLATHALSIFGDHSDIMAAKSTAYALLASSNVQEAQDMAWIAQVASLKSSLPFMHFFDGFRTSHEINTIDLLKKEQMRAMMPESDIERFRSRALNPNKPVLRGSAQESTTFYAQNILSEKHYEKCPQTVQQVMDDFASITGRSYKIYDYFGHPEAEKLIVCMASAADTVKKVIEEENQKGAKCGLLQIRLFRPLNKTLLQEAIPSSVKNIFCLERYRDASAGEQILLNDLRSLFHGKANAPRIEGSHFGLSSAPLNPQMIRDLLENIEVQQISKGIGIAESQNPQLFLENDDSSKVNVFIGHSKKQKIDLKSSLNKLITNEGLEVQRYDEFDYDKSLALLGSHIRISEQKISAPWVAKPDLMICLDHNHLEKGLIQHNVDVPLLISSGIVEEKSHLFTNRNAPIFQIQNLNELDELIMHLGNLDSRKNLIPLLRSLFDEFKIDLSSVGSAADKAENNIELSFDGTFETGTAALSSLDNSVKWSWDWNDCTACGLCSLFCPQGAIEVSSESPFELRVNSDQCSDCGLCEAVCETNAIKVEGQLQKSEADQPAFDLSVEDAEEIKELQFKQPLFRYARGEQGCAQSTYLKLLSQLFGERMVIANATGTSSIIGGSIEHNPWMKNEQGQGPAWANSLFEDNAEFGLGMRVAQRIGLDSGETEVSQWIIGGDGWAYDAGFGGLDHILGSGEKLNVLVLDNELYDNTGGQASKSSPMNSKLAFSRAGKKTQKKDLPGMAMLYDDVYVASVDLYANPGQCIRAFKEAEKHDGVAIIFAHCHSSAQQLETSEIFEYHREAVRSGMHLNFRSRPVNYGREFIQDSQPSFLLRRLYQLDARFNHRNPLWDEPFHEKQVRRRISRYRGMSQNAVEIEELTFVS